MVQSLTLSQGFIKDATTLFPAVVMKSDGAKGLGRLYSNFFYELHLFVGENTERLHRRLTPSLLVAFKDLQEIQCEYSCYFKHLSFIND